MQTWMMTGPRNKIHKREIYEIIKTCDVKHWIIAKETGTGNYEHWQIRIKSSRPDFFDFVHDRIPSFHIEKAETDKDDYERKEGKFWTSSDTVEIRKCRFGKQTDQQRRILKMIKKQDVRSIDVFYDPKGSRGKSWLTVNLWETGKALVVPRYSCTPDKLSAFICSAWKGEEIIVIDIPRASKPTKALYETMEEIKDGLVFDPRYSGKTRNVRGTKLIVFTNHTLDLKQLSSDRWKLHGWSGDGALSS